MYRHTSSCTQRPRCPNRLRDPFQAPLELETEEFRHDLVARIRRAIADGVYETPEKWEAALDRLAADLK